MHLENLESWRGLFLKFSKTSWESQRPTRVAQYHATKYPPAVASFWNLLLFCLQVFAGCLGFCRYGSHPLVHSSLAQSLGEGRRDGVRGV